MKNKSTSKRLWELLGIVAIITVIAFIGCSNPTGMETADGEGGSPSIQPGDDDDFKHPGGSPSGNTSDTYTITFISTLKGNTEIDRQVVANGGFIKEPDEPEESGMEFKGWIYQHAPTQQVIFKDGVAKGKVVDNMTLVADWGTLGLLYDEDRIHDLTDEMVSIRGIQQNIDLATLVLPTFHNGNPVTTIKTGAFSRNPIIQSVTIGANTAVIEKHAFGHATSRDSALTDITFVHDNTLKTIGEGAFQNTKLSSITIPASVTSIAEKAFSGITNSLEVIFQEDSKLVVIGISAFEGSRLTKIEIPANVSNLRDRVFANTVLEEVSFASGSKVTVIPEHAFSKSKVQRVTLPNELKSIARYAFEDANNLKKIDIPSGSKVGAYAFTGWGSDQEISIPMSESDTYTKWDTAWYSGSNARIKTR